MSAEACARPKGLVRRVAGFKAALALCSSILMPSPTRLGGGSAVGLKGLVLGAILRPRAANCPIQGVKPCTRGPMLLGH